MSSSYAIKSQQIDNHLKARDIITTATALGENDQLVNQPAGRSSNVLPAHSAIFEREKCRCGSV
ncbi:unnamed protein product [Ceratitis capitata]|uniref:(Mediterranean fruit fly) hypothetical protein n=1 Tax=Ceratitis capitata TaxID=7213 RepID=A0A811UGD9_CERCA|nr:unnamed protein product [Ceratitis capitata]